MQQSVSGIPIFFLKSPVPLSDGYVELFGSSGEPSNVMTKGDDFAQDLQFRVNFVEVLEHSEHSDSVKELAELIVRGNFNNLVQNNSIQYQGIIFTSPRAVNAFHTAVKLALENLARPSTPDLTNDEHFHNSLRKLLPHSLLMFVVGLATARRLDHLPLQFTSTGGQSGSGKLLGQYILNYMETHMLNRDNFRLLFLSGDKRLDDIPNVLTKNGVQFTELCVYGTRPLATAVTELTDRLTDCLTAGKTCTLPVRKRCARCDMLCVPWIVVFSPSGCEIALEALERTAIRVCPDGEMSKPRPGPALRKFPWIRIATIGPTSRQHLTTQLGLFVDACAAEPNPTGLWRAIADYLGPRLSGVHTCFN